MISLLGCILSGACLFLVFKLLQNHKVAPLPAIALNYWVCLLIGIAVDPKILNFENVPLYSGWALVAVILGILFVGGFFLTHLTVRHTGITAASIASKQAMVISVLAAFFLYGDSISILKILGILLAIVAIVLASLPRNDRPKRMTLILGYPILLFLISGVIETLIKYSQARLMEPALHAHFTTFLFGTAAIFGTLWLFGLRIFNRGGFPKSTPWRKTLLGGMTLAVPNFFGIFFLVRALERTGWESSVVYPIIDVAIVFLSAVTARLFFKERLSRINVLGIAFAITALICLVGSALLLDTN